mgnify:CR=1 FL=1
MKHRRAYHKRAGDDAGYIFCGLCTIIFCRSGASCDRTVAFRLERNRSPDGTETLEAMGEAFGTKPEDLRVCIGPSICRDCYEVSEDVADAFKEEFGAEISQDDSTSCYSWNGKSILTNKGNGKYQLDLWGANRLVLLDAGILPEHLAVTNVCTKCNPDLLYSHRVMGDKRGNLAAFLSLK